MPKLVNTARSKQGHLVFFMAAAAIVEILVLFWSVEKAGWIGAVTICLAFLGCLWSLLVGRLVVSILFRLKSDPRTGTKTVLLASLLKLPLTLFLIGCALWLSTSSQLPVIFEIVLVYSFAVWGLIVTSLPDSQHS
jgi:hypothetical protein